MLEPAGPDRWRLREPVRERVSFRRLNLLTVGAALRGQRFEAIACRNVLIYFDRETQLAVVRQLRELLAPGGCLLLGHSEMFFNVDLGLVPLHTARATLYQRPLEEDA